MGEKERVDEVKDSRRETVMTGILVGLLSVLIIGGMVIATLSL